MQDVAKNIRQAYFQTNDQEEPKKIMDICVSFNGTWMKRLFTCLYGVGGCKDIMTGVLIDFEVVS